MTDSLPLMTFENFERTFLPSYESIWSGIEKERKLQLMYKGVTLHLCVDHQPYLHVFMKLDEQKEGMYLGNIPGFLPVDDIPWILFEAMKKKLPLEHILRKEEFLFTSDNLHKAVWELQRCLKDKHHPKA